MSDPLAPYEAVLIASYGGPDKPDDVLPFMRNATAGKNIPDSRLLEVSKHYDLFGGRSPINALNRELRDCLEVELRARGATKPVVIGNRNWHPFFTETAADLVAQHRTKVVAVATSAYASYSSCRQYHEDLDRAQESTGGKLQIDKIDPFAETPGFIKSHAKALVAAVNQLRDLAPGGPIRVLFVTHSIPLGMDLASGTGEPSQRYLRQHQRVAKAVTKQATASLGEKLQTELVFCSRSGPPQMPWLEPDINDRLEEIAPEVAGVVAAPIGFINDHMEVAYDLDTEAKATAAELNLPYVRAATVNTDPEFVAMLADHILNQAAVARGEATATSTCNYGNGNCCLPKPQEKP